MATGVRAKPQPLLESKGVDLALDFLPGLSVVVCDRWRMEQVAINRLANAIRFTLAGGRIVVRGRADVEGFVFSVASSSTATGAGTLGLASSRSTHGRCGRGRRPAVLLPHI